MEKISSRAPLFIILFGVMILFGFTENIRGVTLPLIKTQFGVSYEQQGAMVALHNLGFVLFSFAGGMLMGSFGIKKTFLSAFFIISCGLILTFFVPGFLPVAGALFIISAGLGFFEISSNGLAAQLFTTRPALFMSLLHSFYGLGSSFSPRLSGTVAAAFSWRHIYLFTFPLILILLIPSLLTRFPRPSSASANVGHENTGINKASFFTALKTPMVWVFGVMLGLMVGVELSSANWAGLYFKDLYQLDPKTSGAAFLSNFYILFTISRLVSGFAIEKIGYIRSLFIATAATILVFIIGFSLGPNGIYVLPALGFFTALFWPTTLAIAIRYFKKNAPIMNSAIIVLAGAINALIQFFIGLTNRFAGPAWGYRSCIIYALLAIVALVFLARQVRITGTKAAE